MADDREPRDEDPVGAPDHNAASPATHGPGHGPDADATSVLPGRPTGPASSPTSDPTPRPSALDATQADGSTAPRPAGDATSIMPGVGAAGAPGAAGAASGEDGARWSARAQVRPARPGQGEPGGPDGWDEEPAEDPYGGRSWFTPVLIGVLVLVLLAVLGYGLFLIVDAITGDRTAPPAPSATVSASPSASTKAPEVPAATTAPPSETAPAQVSIPVVDGDSLEEATAKLTRAGLKTATELVPDGAVPAGTVLGSRPAAGTRVAPGSTVILLVASAPTSAPPVSPTPRRSATASARP